MRFEPGSRLLAIHDSDEAVEGYHCSYGLNPACEGRFATGPLRVAARDLAGDVRAVELDGHPFFVATLYQPERSGLEGRRHPLIAAFVDAVPSTPRPPALMSPPALMRPPRSRLAYGIALVLVIAAGLGSRVSGARCGGDRDLRRRHVYATMVFVGLGDLAPRWSTARLAVTALACSCAIEAASSITRRGSTRSGTRGPARWSSATGSCGAISPATPPASRSPPASRRRHDAHARCDKLLAWVPSRRSSSLACPAPST